MSMWIAMLYVALAFFALVWALLLARAGWILGLPKGFSKLIGSAILASLTVPPVWLLIEGLRAVP